MFYTGIDLSLTGTGLIVLDEDYPYKDVLDDLPELLFVIYPRTSDDLWGVRGRGGISFSLSPPAPYHLSSEYPLIKPGNNYGKDPCPDNEISICTYGVWTILVLM